MRLSNLLKIELPMDLYYLYIFNNQNGELTDSYIKTLKDSEGCNYSILKSVHDSNSINEHRNNELWSDTFYHIPPESIETLEKVDFYFIVKEENYNPETSEVYDVIFATAEEATKYCEELIDKKKKV